MFFHFQGDFGETSAELQDPFHPFLRRHDHIRDHQEIEADYDATMTMLRGVGDERINGVGMLLGFSAMLLLKAAVQNKKHPDSDDRIETVLRRLNLDEISPLWGIASLSFKLWDDYYGKSFTWPDEVEHFKELFYDMFEQLRAAKNRSSGI